MEAFQVIDAILDVLDATGMVVALMTVWYTWVVPSRISPEQVAAMELEQFLRAVAVSPVQPAGSPQEIDEGVQAPSEWTETATDRA